MRQVGRSSLWMAVAASVLMAAGCGGQASQAESPVPHKIILRDYGFEAPSELAAGTYRFAIRNEGEEPHELVILPAGERDEEKALMEVEEDELPPGATKTVEVSLAPGAYEFVCFLPEHFEKGMHAPLTVR